MLFNSSDKDGAFIVGSDVEARNIGSLEEVWSRNVTLTVRPPTGDIGMNHRISVTV